MIHFFESCIPPKTTSQQKRLVSVNGKPRFFKSKKIEDSLATFDSILMPHRPEKPMEGALSLIVTVTFPYTSGTPKKDEGKVLRHGKKPDLDNWVKGFIDRMVALGFMLDDGQIDQLMTKKERGSRPGIAVTLTGCTGSWLDGFTSREVVEML